MLSRGEAESERKKKDETKYICVSLMKQSCVTFMNKAQQKLMRGFAAGGLINQDSIATHTKLLHLSERCLSVLMSCRIDFSLILIAASDGLSGYRASCF